MDHGEVGGEGGGVQHRSSRLQVDAGSGEAHHTRGGLHERLHRRPLRHRSHQGRHPVSFVCFQSKFCYQGKMFFVTSYKEKL